MARLPIAPFPNFPHNPFDFIAHLVMLIGEKQIWISFLESPYLESDPISRKPLTKKI